MKYIYTLIISSIFLFGLSPYLNYSYGQNLEKSRAILIVGTKSCPPCIRMYKEVWPKIQDDIKEYDVYIIDADIEKGYVNKYKVRAFPTVILVERTKSNKAKELRRFVGYRDVQQIRDFLKGP